MELAVIFNNDNSKVISSKHLPVYWPNRLKISTNYMIQWPNPKFGLSICEMFYGIAFRMFLHQTVCFITIARTSTEQLRPNPQLALPTLAQLRIFTGCWLV